MPIQGFSFPVPETRFFQAGQHVYKFKIRRGERSRTYEEVMLDGALVSEELESAVRAVLANLDGLQPFTTQHFNIFPYMSKWERVSKLRFMDGGVQLSTYPFVITLYVECHELASHTVTTTSGSPVPLPFVVGDEKILSVHSGEDSSNSVEFTQLTYLIVKNRYFTEDLCAFDPSPQADKLADLPKTGSPLAWLMVQKRWFVAVNLIYKVWKEHDHVIQPTPLLSSAKASQTTAPETSDPNSETEQKMGIITKFASSLFPFSMFFRKSSAK